MTRARRAHGHRRQPAPPHRGVHRSPTAARIPTEANTLDGEDVVPGWKLPVAALFEDDGDLAARQ